MYRRDTFLTNTPLFWWFSCVYCVPTSQAHATMGVATFPSLVFVVFSQVCELFIDFSSFCSALLVIKHKSHKFLSFLIRYAPPVKWGGIALLLAKTIAGCEVIYTPERVYIANKMLSFSSDRTKCPRICTTFRKPHIMLWTQFFQEKWLSEKAYRHQVDILKLKFECPEVVSDII